MAAKLRNPRSILALAKPPKSPYNKLLDLNGLFFTRYHGV